MTTVFRPLGEVKKKKTEKEGEQRAAAVRKPACLRPSMDYESQMTSARRRFSFPYKEGKKQCNDRQLHYISDSIVN